jgi:hypothetical protein
MKHRNIILALSLLSSSASAIVRRHDVPDQKFLDYAQQFAAYGDVAEAGSTLIAPQWLLTAGHVAESISPYTSFAMVGGNVYDIDRIIMHPENSSPGANRVDLALLRLTKPVPNVDPIALYRSAREAGQVVSFFGRGMAGTGKTGPSVTDGFMRGATNRIESVTQQTISMKFDPAEAALPLEGISGPGDSGGPGVVRIGGKWYLVGVSSANVSPNGQLCRYNSMEVYARVSTATAWIDQTLQQPPGSTVSWKIGDPVGTWPADRNGEIGPKLVACIASGDREAYEAFNLRHRSPKALARATKGQRTTTLLSLHREFGTLQLVETATGADGTFFALLRTAKGTHHQLTLFFDADGFDGFNIVNARPRA